MNNNSFVVIIMLREYYYIIIIVLLFLDVIVVSYEEKRHSLQFSFCAFQELDLKILSALAQKKDESKALETSRREKARADAEYMRQVSLMMSGSCALLFSWLFHRYFLKIKFYFLRK